MSKISKIAFYLNRAAAMSFPEICYRIKWKANMAVTNKLKMMFGLNNNYLKSLKKIDLLNDFKKSKRGNFFFENYARERVLKEYKKYFSVERARRIADNYCRHLIPIFEFNKNLGKEINWNKDYKTGKSWPKEYVGKLHHEDNYHGFVRYVWELNRQSHLTAIARAYYLTHDKKYAEETLLQIEGWIKQNPYLKTINWFSGLEIGVRIINWVWSLKFIQEYDGLNEERFSNIVQSVYLQANTIFNNLSLYSSANNHLTGELAALRLVSKVFPQLKHSLKWHKISKKLLEKEAINQIYPDGAGAEQSTNYLIFILDLFLQAFIVSDEKIPADFKSRFEKAGEFIAALSANRSCLPDIGDSDDAHLIDFIENHTVSKSRSMLNSLSIIFSSPIFKDYGKEIDEKTFWIFGIKGIEKYNSIKNPRKTISVKSRFFDNGGYFVSFNKNCSLIFDCGNLGYLSTASHGHCDALSFLFSKDGKEFFIDSGTYIYHGAPELRNHFRSTEAHNTVKIDYKDQSEIKGTFIYGRKANVKVVKSSIGNGKDEITVYHNGYENIGVIHKRSIIHHKKSNEIEIIDNIRMKGQHNVSVFFNLHPNVALDRKDQSGQFLLRNHNSNIKLQLDERLNVRVYKGSINPIIGWFSPSFGTKVPTYCIEGWMTANKSVEFRTKIKY